MKTATPKITALFLIVVAAISFMFIFNMYQHASFNDLRNRVVGSRLAASGHNPYFHKYNPATDSTSLLDPYERRPWIVNGNTITPTALLLTNGIHRLPQYQINGIWLWLSMACLLTCLYFLQKTKQLVGSVFLLLLMLGVSWKMHLFKGQMYIMYTALAIITLYFNHKNKPTIALLCGSLLLCLRPNAAILLLPIIWQTRKLWPYWLLALVAMFIAPCLYYNNFSIWQQYFTAMHWHGLENANQVPELTIAAVPIPNTLEGWPTMVSSSNAAIEQQLSPDIASVQKLLLRIGLPGNTIILIALMGVLVVLAYLFTLKSKPGQIAPPYILVFASIAYCISDYFLPAVRFNYNFVQILIPVYIIALYRLSIKPHYQLLLLIGLLLQIIKLKFIPECYTLSEMIIMLTLLLIVKDNNKTQPKFN